MSRMSRIDLSPPQLSGKELHAGLDVGLATAAAGGQMLFEVARGEA